MKQVWIVQERKKGMGRWNISFLTEHIYDAELPAIKAAHDMNMNMSIPKEGGILQVYVAQPYTVKADPAEEAEEAREGAKNLIEELNES